MSTWLERWHLPPGDGPVVAVKDLMDVAGTVTTAGCRALADSAEPASEDAECIAAVRSGGGRLAGKTNLHELAFGTSGINPWFGMPENPADHGRVPGGSSSGSAVAVAIGEADVGLGTDTGGSIRIPAACCGVVGLKPTHGLVSAKGVWPLAPSYDTVGVLAADVRGIEAGMRLLGHPLAPRSVVLPDRVGLARLPPNVAGRIDPLIAGAIEAALAEAGLRAEHVELASWDEAWRAHQQLLCQEAFSSDGFLLAGSSGARAGVGVGDETRERLLLGSRVTGEERAAARTVGHAWAADLRAAVARFGVLALPTLAERPPLPEDFKPGFNLLTAPVNFAGLPAIALPVPVAGAGRPPASLQLVGGPGAEDLVCALAGVVEAAVRR